MRRAGRVTDSAIDFDGSIKPHKPHSSVDNKVLVAAAPLLGSAPLLLALLLCLGGVVWCVVLLPAAACRCVSFACWAAAAGRSSTAVYVCCPGPVAAAVRGFGLTSIRPTQVLTRTLKAEKVEYRGGGHGP